MDGNVVQHEWGNEIVWANTELYKGKILVFKEAGSRTPMQYHNNTLKTFFVNSGTFQLRHIDTADGQMYDIELTEGSTFNINTNKPYQLTALNAQSSISEVSNSVENDEFYIVPSGVKE
jgi:hypothetical protein